MFWKLSSCVGRVSGALNENRGYSLHFLSYGFDWPVSEHGVTHSRLSWVGTFAFKIRSPEVYC